MRKVYFDFQDGNNFIDVSDYVKYDTFRITTRAFNDTYHSAQNEASFEIIYDETIFPLMHSLTKEIIVRILDLDDTVLLSTESSILVTTEDDIYYILEHEMAIPIFFGTIPPTRSYKYNGLIDNIIMTVTAIDELSKLDVPIGDVLFSDCAIANSADITHSLIHLISGIAGITPDRINSVLSIPSIIDRFAPTNPEDTVHDVLDTLLYEYGYVLNMSGASIIDPIRWIYPVGTIPEYIFNEDNIIREVSVNDVVKKYDGAKVIYYELKSAPKVLLYRDDNCGFTDDGEFSGYPIPAGFDYPPEVNVIDETTGLPTVVYQEYTDDSIKYWTNKAIENNLDYNYKAFSSNFSAMVATENHFLDDRLSTGITNPTLEFHNTRCRIVYSNPTLDSDLRVFFSNVYADVWYKSAEHSTFIHNIVDATNVFKYTTEYVFIKDIADILVGALAMQFKARHTNFSLVSEENVPVGELVYLIMNDGTNQICFIRDKVWDERELLYTYSLISASTEAGTVTGRTASLSVTINNELTFGSYSHIGTPEAVQILVPTITPKYLGIAIVQDMNSNAGTLYYVSGVPDFATGAIFNANVGDWVFIRGVVGGAGDEVREIRIWSGTAWISANVTNYHRTTAAQDLMSVCKIYGTPTSGDSYEWFNSLVANQAFIDFLMVRTLELQSPGKIVSSDYVAGATGFQIAADGSAEFNDINARGNIDAVSLNVQSASIIGINWGTPAILGTTVNLPSLSLGHKIVNLGNASVAILYRLGSSSYLSYRYWDGVTFISLGTTFVTTNTQINICALGTNKVAIHEFDAGLGYYCFSIYSFSHSTLVWSRDSNSGVITNSGTSIQLLSTNIDNTQYILACGTYGGEVYIRMYTLAYSLVNTTSITPGFTAFDVTCVLLDPTTLIIMYATEEFYGRRLDLRKFDGSTWNSVCVYDFSVSYYGVGSAATMQALNSTDILYHDRAGDGNDLHRIFRYLDGELIQLAPIAMPQYTSYGAQLNFCTIDGCTFVQIDVQATPLLRMFRLGYSLGIPYESF